MKGLIVFSLCVIAVHASGEFSILSNPKSIVFKGNEVLSSDYLGDMLYASMGNAVAEDVPWNGLTITNPFNLAKNVIVVSINGVRNIGVTSIAKKYPIKGGTTHEALNSIITELESKNMPVCEIDFQNFEEAIINYNSCFGDNGKPAIKETKTMNSELHIADKKFLQAVSLINAASDNLHNLQKFSNFLVFRLSMEPITKAHGDKSEAVSEAIKLLNLAIGNLGAAARKSSDNEALVVVISNAEGGQRFKRETVAPNQTANPYNLASYYSPDYPVIFNIILWFLVAFFLSLLAICYAIGTMDPGRDSIIYRMTSTRMKKEN